VRPLAAQLATMPSFRRPAPGRARRRAGAALALLERHGIVAPQDLPLRIVPDDPAALDGWRFA